MTHTPGPWESMKDHMPFKVGDTLLFKAAQQADKVFDGIEILDKAGDEVLIVPTDMIQYYDEMASFAVLTFNVHLDMLEALEAQAKFDLHCVHCDRCGRAPKYCDSGWQLWNTAGNLRNQAIAKAKGRPKKES